MAVEIGRLKELFATAAELPPADRAAFLNRECGRDVELRQQMEVLLRAHDDPGSFLADQPASALTSDFTPDPAGERAAVGVTTDFRSLAEPGTVIAGRYTLVEHIGEGGMGEVWVAKQSEPVKRKVALKLIKAGMDSKSVIQRFEQERQALALMDHPNIAKVLDGGITADRRPYFVMELVNGLPLSKFCDEAKLGINERLELFIPICQAVQHAHQKGIVHRDLKPANILVTLIDGKPVPKVIDFGVAKATGGKLTDESMSTQFGAVVGTLEYMSPEQAGFSGDDIDTRADIYSLGVILYELLTGLRPFDSQRLKKAALDEMIRMIREEEPSKPSTRLSTNDSLPNLAAVRAIEPNRLTALLRGELDWVVMRCLEKQRDRRYETANGLARDIQRYLANEPVEARPASASYRLQKFVARHKGQVIAASLVLMALVGGIVGTTWGLFEAQRQEEIARKEAIEKEKARAAEAERAEGERLAKQQAEYRLSQVEKANELLSSIFKTLDPKAIAESGRPLQAILVEKLDGAVEKLQSDIVGDPMVVAQMQTSLGQSLLGLGEPKKAIVVFDRARATELARHGPNGRETIRAMNHLAQAYEQAGRMDESRALYDETLRRALATLGPDDDLTIDIKANLASWHNVLDEFDKAIPLLEDALARVKAKHGPESFDVIRLTSNLALAYLSAHRGDKATPIFETALESIRAKRGLDHPETLIATINLGCSLNEQGRIDASLELLEGIRQRTKVTLDKEHPVNLMLLNALAGAYMAANRYGAAVPLYEEAVRLHKVKFGADHPNTINMQSNLGNLYLSMGQLENALPLLHDSVQRTMTAFKAGRQNKLLYTTQLADCYKQMGQPQRAVLMLEDVCQVSAEKLGPNHAKTLECRLQLATSYQSAGRTDDALTVADDVAQRAHAHLPPNEPQTLHCLGNLGALYFRLKKLDKSIPIFEELLPRHIENSGRSDAKTLLVLANLASNYVGAGRPEKAAPLCEELLVVIRANPSAIKEFGWEGIGSVSAACFQKLGDEKRTVAVLEEMVSAILAQPASANSPRQIRVVENAAVRFWQKKQLDKSIPMLEEVLRRRTLVQGTDHMDTLGAKGNLGINYKDAGRVQDAIPLLEECLQGSKKLPSLQSVQPHLLQAYALAGENAKAAMLLRDQLPEARKKLPKNSPQIADLLAIIGMGLSESKEWIEAEQHLRECLSVREANDSEDYKTFSVTSLLGGALLGQKKYADAEPLLLKGYEGMKQREDKIPKTGGAERLIPQAIDRLIELYTLTNKPDEVQKWQAERAKYPESKKEPEKK